MKISFTKTQGLGNDFIIIDCLDKSTEQVQTIISSAKKILDRNFGIGGDGILLVLPSKDCDYQMRIINADGSEPEMCGNGIRCFGEYLRQSYGSTNIDIETLAGVIQLNYHRNLYQVNMGKPRFANQQIPVANNTEGAVSINQPLTVGGQHYQFTAVSMGNPHCVIFLDEIKNLELPQIGPQIENHPLFPNKTNVEFIKIKSPTEIDFRVWERGCGETLACGTGACAAVAAGIMNGLLQSPVLVHLRGGDLKISWNVKNLPQLIADPLNEELLADIMMEGPAEIVFTGEMEI